MGKVTRRDFMVKGGKYALFTGTAMQVLLTSKRAMAQSGLAGFRVSVEGQIAGAFDRTTATSPQETWTGLSNNPQYSRYTISFTGDTSHLPDPVSVTVTWSKEVEITAFNWDNTNQMNSSRTFSVPKAGGSIGYGGTVLDTNPSRIPLAHNSDQNSGHTGLVVFSATGVASLRIDISLPWART